jgi:phenylacetate-CoA ligase
MLVLPSGERRWPLSGFRKFRDIAPIRQYQIVQHSPSELEARFVADRPLRAGEERQLAAAMRDAMGYPFEIRFTCLEAFPRSASGKFEDFISLLQRH